VELFYSPDSFLDRIEKIKKINIDDIKNLSNQIFTKDNMYISMIGKITTSDQNEITNILEGGLL
jgi:predicted Zn-dependent peptidase